MKHTICLLLALVLLLSACGAAPAAQSAAATAAGPYLTVTAENGTITIDKKLLSTDVLYVNYAYEGLTLQLLAGVASDGSCRVSLNTCQSCNPSPKAYFVQDGDKLVCQNCGNRFTMDNLGQQARGCNPTYLESTQTEDAIVISTAELESYAPMFTNWKGITA